MSEGAGDFWPSCPPGWRVIPIRECLKSINAPIDMSDDQIYDLVSIRRRNGGMFFRESLPGRKILTKNLEELQPDSFVIARMQIVHGACALTPEQFVGAAVSQSYSAFSGSDLCVTRYFSRLAQQPFMIDYFLRCSHGVVIEKMTFQQERWLEQPVCLPPLEEQRRIAEILDTIDETIQATERVIAKLEIERVGVVHDLLGDGSWNPSLPIVELRSLLVRQPKNGKSPVEDPAWRGTYMLGLGCLTESGFRPVQLKFAPVMNSALSGALLKDGDILISRSNTRERVGLAGRFRSLGSPCIYPDLMMRLIPEADVNSDFLELVLQAPPARRQIEALASGTSGSMVKITGRGVSGLKVPLASAADQRRIVDVFASFRQSIGGTQTVLHKLRTQRAGLAADLLSGRVRTVAS